MASNCAVYSGAWMTVDGTSCSSPTFAGIVANLNAYQLSQGKPTLGFSNPLFYQMYYDNANTFSDVRVGNSSCTEAECCDSNFGFQAAAGWDPVGGLGTPNVGVPYLSYFM